MEAAADELKNPLSERVNAATEAIYIKLGSGGGWTEACVATRTIQLGFGEVPHPVAAAALATGDWSTALALAKRSSGSPTSLIHKVQAFYEAGRETIWFTFHQQRLWWCLSKDGVYDEGVQIEQGAHRFRLVDGDWSDEALTGERLWIAEISGKLTRKRGFFGALLIVKGDDLRRLKDRIQGRFSREAVAVEVHKQGLVAALADAVETLNEYDFENLADLVLSRAGLQRATPVGATQKTIDFEGNALFSGEAIHVQVKAGLASHVAAEEEWLRGLAALPGRVILVANVDTRTFGTYQGVEIVDRHRLAQYCLDYGLVDWVIRKAG